MTRKLIKKHSRRTKKRGGASLRKNLDERQQDNKLQLKHALEAKVSNYTSGYAGWGERDQRNHMAKDIQTLRNAYRKCINKQQMPKVSMLNSKIAEMQTELENLESLKESVFDKIEEMRLHFVENLKNVSDYKEFNLLSIEDMLWITDENKEEIAQLQEKYKDNPLVVLREMIGQAINAFDQSADSLNQVISLYILIARKENPSNRQ
jgi:hypothetical protein